MRAAMIASADHGLRKERAIVSETQLGSMATDAAGPDAETGEADDVSEYSEEAGGLDPAAEAADAASADDGFEADVQEDTEEEEKKPDDAREEFERELRMLPGDWYVVHSYAGYENRVKTNLESRIQSHNMEDYIFQIEVP